jgi:hypothetical protein
VSASHPDGLKSDLVDDILYGMTRPVYHLEVDETLPRRLADMLLSTPVLDLVWDDPPPANPPEAATPGQQGTSLVYPPLPCNPL